MPAITFARYSVNHQAWNDLSSKERQQRTNTIDHYNAYYAGDMHRWLRQERAGLKDENVIVNLCGRAVNKLAEFVAVPSRYELPGETEDAHTPAQILLDALWDAHHEIATETTLNTLLAGHAYLKLYVGFDGQYHFTYLDPRYMTVFWDAMNTRQPLFYRAEWTIGDSTYRQDIVPDIMLADAPVMSAPQSWAILDYSLNKSNKYELTASQAWEYPFPPIIEWPIQRLPLTYYGTSQLAGSTALNDSINFVISNTARIIKHHAHPKTFLFGATLEGHDAVGGLWDDLPEAARIETLELQSDLQSSMGLVNLLKGEFFASQRVLDFSTIKDKLGNLTNFGVRMLFSDMVALTETIRRANGIGFARALQALMALNNAPLPALPTPQWPDPLPANRLEVLESAKIEKELGTTSTETLTREIGRDPDLEAQRKSEEGTDSTDALINSLDRMGTRGLFGGAPIPQSGGLNGRQS